MKIVLMNGIIQQEGRDYVWRNGKLSMTVRYNLAATRFRIIEIEGSEVTVELAD